MEYEDKWNELKKLVAGGLMVRSDSRAVQPGEVFVAMSGVEVDGARFIPDAIARGAAWIVTDDVNNIPHKSSVNVVVHDKPRRALGDLASVYFGTANHKLTVVGITGTNGKTTLTYMVEHLLSAAGHKVGVIGTVNYRWPGFSLDAPRTTPDCWQLHELVANMAKSGVTTLVMEVSSHALDQDRVWGLNYDVALMTNVTQDHLDYHKTMDGYFQAKAKLFSEMNRPGKIGIVNADDSYGRMLLSRYSPSMGFGLYYPNVGEGPGLAGTVKSSTSQGLELLMKYGDDSWTLTSPLIGKYNASNLLAAQCVGLALGLKPKKLRALESFNGVPGRLERVPNARGLDVFVDYAHTPDALENVLSNVRELEFRKLYCVFGCGGDRDSSKRPIMGQAVCRYADVAVVTSDNPRFEDPLDIINDIRPGLYGCAKIIEEPDRKTAIAVALGEMQRGDVLVIAGKGHETYQEIKGERQTFNDAVVVKELAG